MRLLLIRHGQTPSNVDHLLDTAVPGADLTDFGQAQAAAIPAALADDEIDAIYVSTLVRTHQTAAPLARQRQLEPRIRDGLREIAAGDLEMRGDEPSLEAYIHQVFTWRDDPGHRIAGGETGTEVMSRFDAVIAEAYDEVGPDGTVAVFSHGAMIRMWAAARASDLDLEVTSEHRLENTAMIMLTGDPEAGWSFKDWTPGALGGPELTDPAHTGPGGETEEDPAEDG